MNQNAITRSSCVTLTCAIATRGISASCACIELHHHMCWVAFAAGDTLLLIPITWYGMQETVLQQMGKVELQHFMRVAAARAGFAAAAHAEERLHRWATKRQLWHRIIKVCCALAADMAQHKGSTACCRGCRSHMLVQMILSPILLHYHNITIRVFPVIVPA